MKIWIINHYAEVPPFGKYTRHFVFAKKLRERGYDVDIFTASTVHNTKINYVKDKLPVLDEIIEGVPVHFIRTRDYLGNTRGRIGNMIDYFLGVQSVTKKYGIPDIVYVSSPHPLNWIAAKRIAKRYGARLVAETRDLWPETFVGMGKIKKNHPVALALYRLEKYFYKKADALIFTFPGGNDYLIEKGITRKNVYYVNNGIDLIEFEKDKEKHIYHDDDLENNEEFKVIYTGALGQANQVKTILEAALLLQDQYPQIRFYIFGDGYEEPELRSFVDEMGLTNVKFKGKVEKKFIPSILSKSNLNVITGKALPMYKYGVSLNKIPEYLASGKPILSNLRIGHDVIKEYDAGMVVPPENPSELARGIKEICEMDVSCYNLLCSNALKAAKLYDFEQLTNVLEGSFKENDY